MKKQQKYKSFPNLYYFYKFLNEKDKNFDAVRSVALPFLSFCYNKKDYTAISLRELLTKLNETMSLGADVENSLKSYRSYLIFFKGDKEQKEDLKNDDNNSSNNHDVDLSVQSKKSSDTDDADINNSSEGKGAELIKQAESLYKEYQVRASKNNLATFAEQHGIKLNKGGTFQDMLEQFKLLIG